MIKINKKKEPHSLTKYKLREPLDIERPLADQKVNSDVRKTLFNEQKGLCAYCMSKLQQNKTVIEHIKPKSKYTYLARTYTNLLLTCNNIGNHCDKSKGNNELSSVDKLIFNKIEYYIKYEETGNIYSEYSKIHSDLNNKNMLNLNGPFYLKRNRAEIFTTIRDEIKKDLDDGKNKSEIIENLKKRVLKLENDDWHEAYLGVHKFAINKIINEL